MAESLETFLARQLRTVEQDGRQCERIKLILVDDAGDELPDAFETWDRPFPPAEEFAETINALCDGHAEDFPRGQVVLFHVVSEDAHGTRRGKHNRRTRGMSETAKRVPGGPAAITDGVHAIVRATKELIAMNTQQTALFANQSKAIMENQQALILTLQNERLTRAEEDGARLAAAKEAPQSTEQTMELVGAVLERMSPLVEVLMKLANQPKVQAPTNGAAPQSQPTIEN